MQWMNQSGTLKITHKARVKFSVGNYVDTVDCDVAPMSACHLLLGRPWQFDLDATHSGRSNNYLFMHKGIHHVLKPMLESTIKAEVFAPVKVKKKSAAIIPKPRTALLQEGENDMVIHAAIATASSIDAPLITANVNQERDKEEENNMTVGTQIISLKSSCNDQKMASHIFEDGQNMHSPCSEIICKDYKNAAGANLHAKSLAKDNSAFVTNKSSEPVDFKSKPRTALFQGREDDEPMAPQDNISEDLLAKNMNGPSFFKFGVFSSNEKYIKKAKEIFAPSGLSSTIKFKPGKYIFIGSMKVDIT
jgi:hypothetical protein